MKETSEEEPAECKCFDRGCDLDKIAEDAKAFVASLPQQIWPNHASRMKKANQKTYTLVNSCGSCLEVNMAKRRIVLQRSCDYDHFQAQKVKSWDLGKPTTDKMKTIEEALAGLCPCKPKTFCKKLWGKTNEE